MTVQWECSPIPAVRLELVVLAGELDKTREIMFAQVGTENMNKADFVSKTTEQLPYSE